MSWAEDNGLDWVTEPEDVDRMEAFEEQVKSDFYNQMEKKVLKIHRELVMKKREPSHHPFFPIEQQAEYYFLHINKEGDRIDVRKVDSQYSKNLYRWYEDNHGLPKDSLFMQTLRERGNSLLRR